MRENRTSGSAWGVLCKWDSYHNYLIIEDENEMKKIAFTIFLMLVTKCVLAASTGDTIEIKRIYFKVDGSVAIEAKTSTIPNASADRDCANGETWAKKWAGLTPESSDRIVSALLAAHAQNKSVQIQTDGCTGPWHKITSAYIN